MMTWDLLKSEEDYNELVTNTYSDGEYDGDPPDKYPCMALAEVNDRTNKHYFYYFYVNDAGILIEEHWAQHEEEATDCIAMDKNTRYILKMERVCNGFILRSEHHSYDDLGFPKMSTATNVAKSGGEFIDAFAGYANSCLLKDDLDLRLTIVKERKPE